MDIPYLNITWQEATKITSKNIVSHMIDTYPGVQMGMWSKVTSHSSDLRILIHKLEEELGTHYRWAEIVELPVACFCSSTLQQYIEVLRHAT